MTNKKETMPADYDRWGKTCVKFTDNPAKKETKPSKKVVKTTKKGK